MSKCKTCGGSMFRDDGEAKCLACGRSESWGEHQHLVAVRNLEPGANLSPSELYYREHSREIAQYKRAWYRRNRQRVLERQRTYRRATYDSVKQARKNCKYREAQRAVNVRSSERINSKAV